MEHFCVFFFFSNIRFPSKNMYISILVCHLFVLKLKNRTPFPFKRGPECAPLCNSLSYSSSLCEQVSSSRYHLFCSLLSVWPLWYRAGWRWCQLTTHSPTAHLSHKLASRQPTEVDTVIVSSRFRPCELWVTCSFSSLLFTTLLFCLWILERTVIFHGYLMACKLTLSSYLVSVLFF